MVKIGNLTTLEFEKSIAKRKVICFCAGQGLLDICEKFPLLMTQTVYVVDNFKYGQSIEIKNRSISIISMKELESLYKDEILVIASIQYAKQIVVQLDELVFMHNKDIYIAPLFLENEINSKQDIQNISYIPKKIHYCWFGNNTIPKQFQKNIDTWKRYCPDYEIIEWNESNYDITKCEYMKQAYESKKWGFVPDYARLDIIHTHGGIYLDTDVELLKSWNELLKYELFCGFENQKFVAFGLGFGARNKHPILHEMMKAYEKTEFIKKDGTLNLIASPVYQTEILLKYGLIQNGKTQKNKNYIVFSKEYFAPINPYGFGDITQNTYSIHQYAATWFDERQVKKKEEIKSVYEFIMKRMEI